jgi:hypothetical protein
VERKNPSACATVNFNCCKTRDNTVMPVCKRNYERMCNQLLINPIIRTRTHLISGVYVTVLHHDNKAHLNGLLHKFLPSVFVSICVSLLLLQGDSLVKRISSLGDR